MSTEIVIALLGILASVVTFVLTRKKYIAEVESQKIENMNTSHELYKKVVQDTFEIQDRRIKALEAENEDLRKQIEVLKKQIFDIIKDKVEQ